MIDFRSGYFSSAHGLSSFYYSPVGLTINALPEDAKLYQDSVDGLGVIYDYESIECCLTALRLRNRKELSHG